MQDIDNIFNNLIERYGKEAIKFKNYFLESQIKSLTINIQGASAEDQIFIYNDSVYKNVHIGFSLSYIQKLSNYNDLYSNVKINIVNNKLFIDKYKVNYNYHHNSINEYCKNDKYPIYIINYLDKEYVYLVIDGNHRISNIIDKGYTSINCKLLNIMATINMITETKNVFLYVLINIVRLFEKADIFTSNNIDLIIEKLIKIANCHYEYLMNI